MIIYLLHFDTKLHHAQHYLGCTGGSLRDRMRRHATGNGARLVEVITQAGITWRIARTWRGNWNTEKKLKRQHNSPRFCPICNARVPPQRGYPKPMP
jgi:hypothetical protein